MYEDASHASMGGGEGDAVGEGESTHVIDKGMAKRGVDTGVKGTLVNAGDTKHGTGGAVPGKEGSSEVVASHAGDAEPSEDGSGRGLSLACRGGRRSQSMSQPIKG
jgi:hypothetical protein